MQNSQKNSYVQNDLFNENISNPAKIIMPTAMEVSIARKSMDIPRSIKIYIFLPFPIIEMRFQKNEGRRIFIVA